MKLNYVILTCCTAVSTYANSGTMGDNNNTWTPVVSLSAGPAWEDSTATRTFFLDPNIEKTYAARKKTTTIGAGELFFGAQKRIDNRFYGQIGLDLAVAGDAKLAGDIWDDADPTFNNYAYHYDITHYQVGLKGKLLADMGYWVMPWVSASVNVGFNHSHDFNNTPYIFEAVKNPNFRNNTDTAFSYTVGAGVQKQWNQNWQVGAGYEFADWGISHLGKARGQTLNNRLGINHIYTHGLMLNLTYLV